MGILTRVANLSLFSTSPIPGAPAPRASPPPQPNLPPPQVSNPQTPARTYRTEAGAELYPSRPPPSAALKPGLAPGRDRDRPRPPHLASLPKPSWDPQLLPPPSSLEPLGALVPKAEGAPFSPVRRTPHPGLLSCSSWEKP